jgi:sugar/nucleoside kinase (ribokinase family)
MPTDYKSATLEELTRHGAALGKKFAVIGFDGFIDRIMHAVRERHGLGDNFIPFDTLKAFGERITAAAGKSTNIELFLLREQLGGNGPLMARAMLNAGVPVRYVGALGRPTLHPIFTDFAKSTSAISLANPGITHALEFSDGKLMLGEPASMEELTYARLIETVGEAALLDLLDRANLIALVNWTQTPRMTEMFNGLLKQAWPKLPGRPRCFFFDLADPAKRLREELRDGLAAIAKFQKFGDVILGLNLSEGQQTAAALELPFTSTTSEAVQQAADDIRKKLGINCVVIHPLEGAACATSDGTWWVDGPHCEKPLITTGGGDNFNAGYMTAHLLGLPPPCCLTTAVSVSGFYVRNAHSPSLGELIGFLGEW